MCCDPIVAAWPEIREIGEDELEAFVGVMARAMPREDTRRRHRPDRLAPAGRGDDLAPRRAATMRSSAPATPSPAGTLRPTAGSAPRSSLPERRGAGIGDRLRAELERWAAEHGATELEGPVAEDDEGSLAWAQARGYEEAGRNSRLVLDLTAIEAPTVEPPPGIEIVTWADRPELAEGHLGGRARGGTRHSGRGGDATSARSTSGSSATCAAAATGPRRSSSPSRTARCSATRSSPSQRRRRSARSTTSPASSAPTAAAGSRRP